ncbi:peptidase domain-containing ABC transporter [Rossellomorea aquimaris]|uniref:peptidase domain-containing ABC transporter n=1 Tax=Rossellomorea aquimaris TaxID=189382 RepID=UPI001CD4C50A|nr:peptidase domain-containing ABC transporter [Rossellomorea aquimaris]MCA1060836.1 peptidase domain-containing ABC transporter [Rossellomorea aquimaris]
MNYVHTVQLEKNDCGLACVSSILKFYGNNKSLSYIRDMYISKEIYNLKDLINLLNKIGNIECRAVQINKEKIHEVFLEIKSPCIAHIKTEEDENHYIIVYKIKNNKVVISDPRNKKITSIDITEFKKVFSGVMLITDNSQIIENKGNESTGNPNKLFIVSLLKSNMLMISIVFLLSLIFVVLAVVNSFFFKIVTDYIIPKKLDSFLLTISLVFMGIGLIRGITEYFRTWFIIKVSNKVNVFLSKEYFNKISQLPIKFFENRKDGEIISRFQDAGHITNTISTSVVSAVLDTVIIFGLGFVLFKINVQLFLVVLLLLITLLVLTMFFYEILKKKNRVVMEHQANTNSYLVQFIKNMPTIFAFNKNKYFVKSFENIYSKQISANIEESKTVNLNISLKNIVQSSASIFIIWVGSIQIISDSMTLGDLLFVNSLVLFLMGSLEGLISLQSSIQKANIAMERYFDIFHYPIQDDKGDELAEIREIKISDLSYSFNDESNVLDQVNFILSKNEKVLFVGESGSGKSTLSKLLCKFYEPNDNEIYINGIDINRYSNEEIRKKIIYLNENPFLFNGSIYENLIMGENFTENEIDYACEMARVHDIIHRLPNKFNFTLAEGGVNLSTGQKQRLSLARAILHRPEVLILDESLSNVDPENFQIIYNNLLNMNCLIILITHSFEELLNYDKKLKFDETGKIHLIEYGIQKEEFIEVIGR